MNNNQKLFCLEYIKNGFNGTKAYMEVYKPKSEEIARKSASRLMTKVDVKDYIEKHQAKLEEKVNVSIEHIVDELYDIAFSDRTEIAQVENEKIIDNETKEVLAVKTHLNIIDTGKLDSKLKKVISGYKMTQNGISVETYDKMKALELLGKYLGMFTEKTKSDVTINIDEADRELLKNINSRLKNE